MQQSMRQPRPGERVYFMPDGKDVPFDSEEGEKIRQKKFEQQKKAFEEWKTKALENINNSPSDPDKGLEVLTENARQRLEYADRAIEVSAQRIRSLEKDIANLEPTVKRGTFPEKHLAKMKAELAASQEEVQEERDGMLRLTQKKQEALRTMEMLKRGVETLKQGIKPDAKFMEYLSAEEEKRAGYISDPKTNPHMVTFEEEKATGLRTEQLRFLSSRTNLKRLADLRKMAESAQDVDAGWE